MPTFIKTGYWESAVKSYKGWLNLNDLFIENSGSVSPGQVAFYNSNNSITGSNNLFWNNVNGRLGIGTNSPAAALDVSTDARINSINIGLGGGSISTNLRVGANALSANTTGTSNVTIGSNSMLNNTTGINNVVVGTEAFYTTTTGSNNNVIVGRQAAYYCTAIVDSIAIGAAALSNALSSQRNVAIGRQSMINSVSGNDNTGVGYRALYGAASATFANNTGIGSGALDQLSSGGNNVGVGYLAGSAIALGGANLTSSNSIYVGYNTKPSLNGNTNETVIGYNATGIGSNTTSIGNSSTIATWLGGNLLLGTTINGTFRLDVNGTARVSGNMDFGTTAGASTITLPQTSGWTDFVITNNATANTGIRFRNAAGTRAITIGGSNMDLSVVNGNIGAGTATFTNLSLAAVTGTTIRGFNLATLDLNGDNLLLYSRTGTASPVRILSGSSSATSKGTVYISDYSNLTGTINASAQLQVDSTVQGFLPPRMTTAQKNAIASPAAGLVIYDTGLNKLCVYTGATWQTITSA
jgi:hypothetical protein